MSRPAVIVRPGQVWECLAKYDRGRTFRVLRVEYDAGKGADAAVCEILTNSDHTQTLINDLRTMPHLRPGDRRGHESRIRVDRFRPSASGYGLVQDAAAGDRDADDGDAADIGSLLARVHERLGGGVDIQTFSSGTVEMRWRRLYRTAAGEGELSDERFTTAPDLGTALRNLLAHEDEADRADADEAQMAAEAAR